MWLGRPETSIVAEEALSGSSPPRTHGIYTGGDGGKERGREGRREGGREQREKGLLGSSPTCHGCFDCIECVET